MMVSLLEHFWIKIAAVAMGLLLWFHVATEKVYHHRFDLPVTDFVLKDSLTLSKYPPDSLLVTVSATGKQLLRKKWRRRGVRINAGGFTVGRHRLDLSSSNTSLVTTDDAVSLEEIISPTSVNLEIDFSAVDTVPVIPDLVVLTDEGYAVNEINQPEPATVIVSGPRSVLRKVTSVSTDHKELSGLRNNLTLRLPLARPAGYGIRLEPDSVTIVVEVVPVKTRVFEDLLIEIYNAPSGRRISVLPSSVTVELTGPPKAIDQLEVNSLIASADFRDIPALSGSGQGSFVEVKLTYPAQFKVRSSTVDSVRIRVD